MMRVLVAVVLVLFAGVAPAGAQTDVQPLQNAEIIVQRAGIALSGGNPVPGASSTMGIRLGALPRVSVAGRLTGARLVFPDEGTLAADDELSSIARSLNVDVAVGIFSGFSLLPTVGGFGSIDLLASYGKLALSDDDGFLDDPTSWGAGVRIGILRESFTAPGIAVSGMYRKISDFEHVIGNPAVDGATVSLDNTRALSLRATVGKRLLMLGATAGIGYDKYNSDAELEPAVGPVAARDLETSATTFFANLSWTMLILNLVGEGGVQRADGESAPYGSLAIRIAL